MNSLNDKLEVGIIRCSEKVPKNSNDMYMCMVYYINSKDIVLPEKNR